MKPKSKTESKKFTPKLGIYFSDKKKKEEAEKKLQKLHEATNSAFFSLKKDEYSLSLDDKPRKKISGLLSRLIALMDTLENEIDWNLENLDSFTNRLQESPLIFQYPADEPEVLVEMADAANVPSGVVHQYFENSAEHSVAQANGMQTVAFWYEPDTMQIQCLSTKGSNPEVGNTIRKSFPGASNFQSTGNRSLEPKKMLISQAQNSRISSNPITHLNPKSPPLLTPSMKPGMWIHHKNVKAANSYMEDLLRQMLEVQKWRMDPGRDNYYHWKFLAQNNFVPDGYKPGSKYENKFSM